jgi:putative flippase GtrA
MSSSGPSSESARPYLLRLATKAIVRDQFRLIRYFLAGTAVSIGYTLTIIALVDGFAAASPETASAFSLVFWSIPSYLVHRSFTFRFAGGVGGSAARFLFVLILKLLVSVGLMALITRVYGDSYLIGIALNWIALPLVAYVAMKVWVF